MGLPQFPLSLRLDFFTLYYHHSFKMLSKVFIISSVATAASAATVASNILVIARDAASANAASLGLNGYGIPYTTLLVPQAGASLPTLESSSGGNFGGIVVASGISYDYDSGWASGLTDDQWSQLYAYQLEYGVRMVQYDVYPGSDYGTQVINSDGCCDTGVEQLFTFTDVSDFPTAGLKTGAGVSTEGLWYYSSTILNTSNTKQIASFAANSVVTSDSPAAVINDFDGREQMVFFMSLDPTWSSTSAYIQHAWITWMTRGLHAGWRRVNINTQIDDMMLTTNLYEPAGDTFRITTDDLDAIAAWVPTVNAKMNAGSSYYPEVGFNGNGNIDASCQLNNDGWSICNGGAVYPPAAPNTPAEWKKPLGTGTNRWPSTPTSYTWTTDCTSRDTLLTWWQDHLDSFGFLSHTFTHEAQDNATYSDIYKEISFNQAWMAQVGISGATHFTSNGIIPPAITGLHNGDALQAWWDNGITNCVGDNTRSALLNSENAMWPYFTVSSTDGFDGMQVNPRWATRIYYDCCTPQCTLDEWINTSTGSGTFDDLMEAEKDDTMRHFFGLYHDPYMFHQGNLRNYDTDPITVNGVSEQWSLFQVWVETIVQEFVRLVDWPLVTIKHADVSSTIYFNLFKNVANFVSRCRLASRPVTPVMLVDML